MGYRSEVGLIVNYHAWRALNEAAEKDPSLHDLLFKSSDEILEDQDRGARLIHWSWIKWYTLSGIGCDDACVHLNKLMDEFDESSLSDSEKSFQYRFIRLGEENNDIEDRGDFFYNPFNFGFERRITFTKK